MERKGFDEARFMEYLEHTFTGFENPFLRETVNNIVDYGLENHHVSLDQFCYWLSDMLPEVEFGEVAMFMDNRYLTSEGLMSKLEKESGVIRLSVDGEHIPDEDLLVGNWRVHLIYSGDTYGPDNSLINDSNLTKIEFYDMSAPADQCHNGQLAGRYFVKTLYDEDRTYATPQYMKKHGLNLDLDVPGWTLTGAHMTIIFDWLSKQPLKECDIVKPSLEKYISAAKGNNNEASAINKQPINKNERDMAE